MDLLEYQAKELFSEIGIPILPSQSINDPSELKRLHIPYPVVLKSQVRAGGRGRAGGVRFVENTIDAIAAARAIFNLRIMGEYPQVLLAEARYNAQQEIFLAVLLDYQLQCPVLLGSVRGGIDIETLLKHMHKVVIEAEFSPFYARRLLIKMGLPGESIQSVSAIVEKMYHLFREKDLDLIEINPLGIGVDGEVMALDGKITINDRALVRHRDLVLLTAPKKQQAKPTALELESKLGSAIAPQPQPRWLNGIDATGNIGIVCNSLGLALATWDLIAQEKGKPACCLIMQEETSGQLLPDTDIGQQLEKALDKVMEISGLKVILVNILGNPQMSETVAQAIADYLQPHFEQASRQKGEELTTRTTNTNSFNLEQRNASNHPPLTDLPQVVIRLVGEEIEPYKEQLASMSVQLTENLEQAVTQTITFAKSK